MEIAMDELEAVLPTLQERTRLELMVAVLTRRVQLAEQRATDAEAEAGKLVAFVDALAKETVE